MNVFFRMSAELIYPPSGNHNFQNKVIGAYEETAGLTFEKKYKNNIAGNLGAFDRTMTLKIDDVKAGGHGMVSLTKLNGEFFPSGGSAIMGDMSPFVFAVIDHNSAHHLSYVMARRALATSSATKKIVVNFDQHQDFGKASSEIGCQGWGYFTREGNAKFADEYLAVGIAKPTESESGKYACRNDAAVEQRKNKYNSELVAVPKVEWVSDADGLLTKLGVNTSTTTSDVALYVTIDRDWTNYSHTPYGDGHYDYDKGYANFLIPFLAKAKALIVSLDIIGLPVATGSMGSELKKTLKHDVNDYGAVAASQIKSVYEACVAGR